MTHHTHNGREFLFVEVPEDATDFELHEYEPYRPHITFKVGCGTESFDILRVTLPSGNYEIICKASEAGEEQAAHIVSSVPFIRFTVYEETVHKDYLNNGSWFDTATESLHYLILSLGMEVNKTIILELTFKI